MSVYLIIMRINDGETTKAVSALEATSLVGEIETHTVVTEKCIKGTYIRWNENAISLNGPFGYQI